MSGIEAFHAHLDECAQCRNHPFELCTRGSAILVSSVAGGSPEQRFVDKHFPIPEAKPRKEIGDETWEIAMGAIILDVKMFLAQGGTLAEANAMWLELTAIYNRYLRRG